MQLECAAARFSARELYAGLPPPGTLQPRLL
jgi:hypothetical protein